MNAENLVFSHLQLLVEIFISRQHIIDSFVVYLNEAASNYCAWSNRSENLCQNSRNKSTVFTWR